MEDDKFIKLTKSEKLKLPYYNDSDLIGGIKLALFIPLKEKMDGYTMCAFFVKKDDNWYRIRNYDCFRFMDCSNKFLKGDFENGGIQFFLEGKWICDYGGEFKQIN